MVYKFGENVQQEQVCRYWQQLSFCFWIKKEPGSILKNHYEKCTRCQQSYKKFTKHSKEVDKFVPRAIPDQVSLELVQRECQDIVKNIFHENISAKLDRIDNIFKLVFESLLFMIRKRFFVLTMTPIALFYIIYFLVG